MWLPCELHVFVLLPSRDTSSQESSGVKVQADALEALRLVLVGKVEEVSPSLSSSSITFSLIFHALACAAPSCHQILFCLILTIVSSHTQEPSTSGRCSKVFFYSSSFLCVHNLRSTSSLPLASFLSLSLFFSFSFFPSRFFFLQFLPGRALPSLE